MTTQNLRLKLTRVNALKLKVLPRFPVGVEVSSFLTLLKENGIYTFGVDYTLIGGGPVHDPTTAMVMVLDETTNVYKLVSLSSLLSSGTQIEQHITTAGPVAINPNTGIVRVDQATGAAITLTLPLAAAKTCPVLISDWKGDAGTNNITITLSGSDTFPGGLTSWKIRADTGSVFLRPIPGAGYVL